MHTLEIPRKKKNKIIEFPENWEEMSQKQFLKIMELVIEFEIGKIDYNDLKLQATMVLVGIVITKAPRSKADQDEIAASLAVLVELINYIIVIEKNKKGKSIAKLQFESLKQFLPIIKTYEGPQVGLSNITWEQHTKASANYRQYIQTKEVQYLDKLIGSLYLEAGKEFDAERADIIAEDVADIPYHWKYAVFLFYRNSLTFIQNSKINMNGETIDLSILFKDDKKKSKADGLGLVGLQMSIAESGVFGDMEKTGKQSIYDVYAYLYKNKHAYIEQMKEYNKKKP